MHVRGRDLAGLARTHVCARASGGHTHPVRAMTTFGAPRGRAIMLMRTASAVPPMPPTRVVFPGAIYTDSITFARSPVIVRSLATDGGGAATYWVLDADAPAPRACRTSVRLENVPWAKVQSTDLSWIAVTPSNVKFATSWSEPGESRPPHEAVWEPGASFVKAASVTLTLADPEEVGRRRNALLEALGGLEVCVGSAGKVSSMDAALVFLALADAPDALESLDVTLRDNVVPLRFTPQQCARAVATLASVIERMHTVPRAEPPSGAQGPRLPAYTRAIARQTQELAVASWRALREEASRGA